MASTTQSPKLTQDFFRLVFDTLDQNGDGSISVEEMATAMKMFGVQNVSDEQIKDLFSEADQNHNGTIEFFEFALLLKRLFSDSVQSYSSLLQIDIAKRDSMGEMKKKLSETRKRVSNPDKKIQNVCLLVVVKEEILPVFEKFHVNENPEMTKEMMHLAKVYTGTVDDKYSLTILQVAQSAEYNRHYSGYTQAGAVAAMAAKVVCPDLLISFGTAGGWPSRVDVGDVVIASGCVFLDRTRTSSKNSFDWGVFGGPTVPCSKMIKDLNLKEGLIGAQINYTVTKVHTHLIDCLGLYSIDMESASEAQVLMQTQTNFMALKVISNGIFPGEGNRMEEDYVKHKEMVSKRAAEVLFELLYYLRDKTIADLNADS